MPFVSNTPESFIARSDSKNPNLTCRGITAAGRPCRRPIPPVPQPSSLIRTAHRDRNAAPNLGDERLYCWQHKEQAESYSARSSPGPDVGRPGLARVQERTSLDTLADRLGLIDVQDREGHRKKIQANGSGKGKANAVKYGNGYAQTRPKPKPKPASSLSCCFCFSLPLESQPQSHGPSASRPQPRPVQQPPSPMPAMAMTPQRKSPFKTPRKSTQSQTASLKALIPDTLDTATATALMAELSRPYVESDEAGYIYMFWLTPSAASSTPSRSRLEPPVDAARSLLAPPSPSAKSRRPSDAVSRFADASTNDSKGGVGKKTMLLKIGRAANVQRRMNQWQRQCDYDIQVLRYYPYTSHSPSPSPSHSYASSPSRPSTSASVTPRLTPHAHRVERLVHIELTGMGLRQREREACVKCGREHREWFEVEASRKGIRAVDEVIRRWVDWDEGMG